jgi:hypothetical protein
MACGEGSARTAGAHCSTKRRKLSLVINNVSATDSREQPWRLVTVVMDNALSYTVS